MWHMPGTSWEPSPPLSLHGLWDGRWDGPVEERARHLNRVKARSGQNSLLPPCAFLRWACRGVTSNVTNLLAGVAQPGLCPLLTTLALLTQVTYLFCQVTIRKVLQRSATNYTPWELHRCLVSLDLLCPFYLNTTTKKHPEQDEGLPPAIVDRPD